MSNVINSHKEIYSIATFPLPEFWGWGQSQGFVSDHQNVAKVTYVQARAQVR